MVPNTETPARQTFHWHPDNRRLLPVQVRREGDVTMVQVHGEVDLITHDLLRAAVDQVLDSAPEALVLDLTAVTFCACSGLSVLLDVATRTRESGIPLLLACDNRAVLRPLRLAGLGNQFRVRPTVRRALEDIANA